MFRPDQISDTWLRRECDAGAFNRGRAYFEQGRARVDNIGSMSGGSLVLLGECRGSLSRPYTQEVEIFLDDQDLVLDGHCSCPVAFNCKHVVALMLTWRAGNQLTQHGSDTVQAWLNELTGKETDPLATGNEALLYLLIPPEASYERLSIEFVVSRLAADGSWSRGRKTRPQPLYDDWRSPAYFRAEDQPIFDLIRASEFSYQGIPRSSTETVGRLALLKMLETNRLFLGRERQGPLRAGQPRPLRLTWKREEHNFELVMQLQPEAVLLPVEPALYVDPQSLTMGPVELPSGLTPDKLKLLREAPPVALDVAQKISRQMALALPNFPTPEPVQWVDLDVKPGPELLIHFDPDDANSNHARLRFNYDGHTIRPDDSQTEIVAEHPSGLARIRRDAFAERQAHDQLLTHGLGVADEPGSDYFRLDVTTSGINPRDAWLAWLDQARSELEADGWKISINGNNDFHLTAADDIHGEIETRGNDWFSLRFDLYFDGWTIPLLPLIGQLLEHYQPGTLPDTLYLDVGEGHFVSVPAEKIEPALKLLIDLFDRISGDELLLTRPDAASLADLDRLPVSGATDLLKLSRQLRDFSGLQTARLPTTFAGELRDYQQHGVDWLQFLRSHQLNGILADDMGLGKTIQALAHLTIEKRAGRMQDPCLIVAPTSLMGNWRSEAAHFAPRLKVAVAHGPDRAELFDRFADFDLVLTTYPLLPRDREVLLAQQWHYLILDEAQQIKNPKAQAARVVRKLKTRHRLCLTGTPMENHLGELWAQFDFLMPGFLGDQRHFQQHFRTPIEKHGDPEALQRLTRRTAPFLLRRTKDRVAAELPPKSTIQRIATLGDKQALLYESIRLSMEKKVRKAIASRGLARSHIIVLDALLKLRQVCCDPRLLPAGTPGIRQAGSAKFELLFNLLPSLLDEGRRILLFSQFTTMLGLIEQELARKNIDYTKLTGQTRKREQAINRFRSGEVNLFLISLKTGGVGLNLTEADTVIHYDPWWNPAVEHQATDRAHRIGQDKPVFIYKLITEGTVEEKIVALQEGKHKLAEKIYGKGRERDESAINEATIQALLSAG